MGTLYLVATPIGNLEDITHRALRILAEVALIAAEDTRHTRRLLQHYQIRTPVTSYHAHNRVAKLGALMDALARGDVALVSDAGTPALNDPGVELVRAALDAGFAVSPIPGPSAPIAALVASGLPTESFLYLGYLPRKRNARRRTLHDAMDMPHTLIFLETPHRLLATLEDLEAVLGARPMAVAREMTKIHEEIFRGTPAAARSHFSGLPVRGEITLVVGGNPGADRPPWTSNQVRSALRARRDTGESPGQIAKQVARESGWDRRDVYRLLAEMNDQPG